MKPKLSALIVAGCLSALASPTATTGWTSNFVNTAIAQKTSTVSNFTDRVEVSSGPFVLVVEMPTVKSLMATNATQEAVSAGVTNKMYFVWDAPSHSFTNRTQTIEATKTNLVWNGQQSVGSSFTNYFDVVVRILQPSVAKEVVK